MYTSITIKDGYYVAVSTINDQEVEVGRVSSNVSQLTLRSFHSDMESVVAAMDGVNTQKPSDAAVQSQTALSTKHPDVPNKRFGRTFYREAITEDKLPQEPADAVIQEEAVADAPVNSAVDLADTSSEIFLKSLDQLPAIAVRVLLGLGAGEKGLMLMSRGRTRAGGTWNDYLKVNIAGLGNRSASIKDGIDMAVHALGHKLSEELGLESAAARHLKTCMTSMADQLVLRGPSKKRVKWGRELSDKLPAIRGIVERALTATEVIPANSNSRLKLAPPSDLNPDWLKVIDPEVVRTLLTTKNGILSRVYMNNGGEDMFLLHMSQDVRMSRSTKGSIDKIAVDMVEAIGDSAALPLVKWMLKALMMHPAPKKGKSIRVDWQGAFRKALGETPSKEVTAELTVGFSDPTTYERELSRFKAGSVAIKNWPWLFNEKGIFDFIDFARKGDKVGVLFRSKPNRKSVTKFVEVKPTYQSIRNAIKTARLVGTKGTGCDSGEIGLLVDRLFECFTEAVLNELSVRSVSEAQANSIQGYLNLETPQSPEDVLESLTYPTGRLRHACVVSRANGVFWRLRVDAIDSGKSVKPEYVRVDLADLDAQVNQIASTIASKAKLDVDSTVYPTLRETLMVEARRAVNGLV